VVAGEALATPTVAQLIPLPRAPKPSRVLRTDETILRDFPSLTGDNVRAVIAFAAAVAGEHLVATSNKVRVLRRAMSND
jgi:hypothetical protein